MLSLKDILRTKDVIRWHTVRTARFQSLAEHQYAVTMIARELAGRVMRGALTISDELALVDYTLRHDTPELILGDPPTHVKMMISEVCGDLRNPYDILEDRVCSRYSQAKARVANSPLYYVAKLADYADQVSFIHSEGVNALGRTIEVRATQLYSKILGEAKEKYPTLAWDEASKVLSELLVDESNALV